MHKTNEPIITREKQKKKIKINLLVALLVVAITAVNIYVFIVTSQRSAEYKLARNKSSLVEETPPLANASPTPSDDEWQLKLVKQYQPLPAGYEPDLTELNGTQVDTRIIAELKQMLQAAENDGVKLWLSSGYRSISKQNELYQRTVTEYHQRGLSAIEAEACAATIVARPGSSEHHLGLAIDFNGVLNSFKGTKEYLWLIKNAAEYGFILRYPEGKHEITGVIFEPWHFRYVGKYHAKIIMEMGVTLEEYLVLRSKTVSTL